MVRIIQYLFFFSMLFLMACTKNEFELEFNLAENVTDNYNVTYYATDKEGGITTQAVASVRDGKCILMGMTKKTTIVYITTKKSLFPLAIIVGKGEKISIEGDNKEPLSWKVENNKINRELSDWRIDNISILDANETDSVNRAVKNFVEENPENPVSTILIHCYYDRKKSEKEYVDLMSGLKGEARNKDWRKIIGRTDYTTIHNNYPASLKSLIFRSVNEYSDTLVADEQHPMFLLFWQTGGQEKTMIVDSIKTLIKDYPDKSRIIADVCLDIDSSAWRNAIRRDTLDKVKRFWVPAGIADYDIMKLKVNSIPYYIVFEKDGHQSYRGSDLEEAMKEYRKLQKVVSSDK